MIVSYFRSLSSAARALLWAIAAGLIFSLLNTQMRVLTFQFDPFQTQFLRYLMGLAVMLPRPKYFEKVPNSGYLSNRAGTIMARMGDAVLP